LLRALFGKALPLIYKKQIIHWQIFKFKVGLEPANIF